MVLSPQSRLVRLPTELLLIIIHFLCEENLLPSAEYEEGKFSFTPCHLRSLSLACKHLRGLCISPLFSHLEVTHTDQLRLLAAKCATEPEFARLIRQLDLAHIRSPEEDASRRKAGKLSLPRSEGLYRYGPDILPTFLPGLKSLQWLGLGAPQIDASLLAVLNSHPALATVAIRDPELQALVRLSSSTSLSLSKLRVHSVILPSSVSFRCPLLHSLMGRSLRVVHLTVKGEQNVRLGPGDVLVPGLETLDIGVSTQPTSPMTWLPDFVDKHSNLKLIKFSGHGSVWTRNPDILFPLQFFDALEREYLTCAVDLVSFSISRTSSASLNDWPVVHLEMATTDGAGIFALTIASSMAPRLSSLIVRMPLSASQSVHIDDLISSLCLFQSLRRLELHCISRHLLVEAGTSWVPPPEPTVPPTSQCAVAHAAYRWIATWVAQRILSLDFIHITDEGRDYLDRRGYQWDLALTYQVHPSRSIEVYGTPTVGVWHPFREFVPSCKPIYYSDHPYQPASARTVSTHLLPPRAPPRAPPAPVYAAA
ncbi:hypothetical protein MSAN_01475000 [Mycena sanguinolenta]|uniref:F-box domain-containing protein n=1 Tax=Mycena sanguinolenta TaxID=230812 RepID=A0A8H6Y790_9AGAR|nr:hypothetical protein MSAN_01475000 [Mycena sanguinolenta]